MYGNKPYYVHLLLGPNSQSLPITTSFCGMHNTYCEGVPSRLPTDLASSVRNSQVFFLGFNVPLLKTDRKS